MENKFKYIIIALAVVSAFVLYFVGIRRLKNLQTKRRNFFITSLLIALSFIGCDFGISGTKDNSDQSLDINRKDDPERIKILNQTGEWKAFKTAWKNLDAVEPANDKDSGNYSYGSYATLADGERGWEISDAIAKKMDSLSGNLQSLVDKKLIDSLEVKLLRNLCSSRSEYLFFGFRSMMTRMMPPPGLIEKEKSVAALEFRIDMLLKLEKRGKIDSTELELALKNIDNEIRKFSLLDIIGEAGLNYYSYDYIISGDSKTDTINVVNRTITDFEKAYSTFMKEYNPAKADEQAKLMHETYIRTKTEMDEFSGIFPKFCDLIRDLVANE